MDTLHSALNGTSIPVERIAKAKDAATEVRDLAREQVTLRTAALILKDNKPGEVSKFYQNANQNRVKVPAPLKAKLDKLKVKDDAA